VEIPGQTPQVFTHAVFDLNGTLALDGLLVPGLADRLQILSQRLTCLIASADTNGTLQTTAEGLGVQYRRVTTGREKVQLVRELRQAGASGIVAVGNGHNDVDMLRTADLAIAVVGGEGADPRAVAAADIVCPSPEVAVDLLLHPSRIVATLRP